MTMQENESSLFRAALESTRDGLVISEAQGRENPIIYANPAFEQITGYRQDEIIGRDCRFLQGETIDHDKSGAIRKALEVGEPILITLRNFRRDGTPFWNELSISPIRDGAGTITHFVGIQKDVTERVELQQKLAEANRRQEDLLAVLEEQNKRDSLTGLYNRKSLSDEAEILWEGAKRSNGLISVLFLDIDHFKSINDSYGHQAGDACLQKVGEILHECASRRSEIAIRYGGEEFVLVSLAGAHTDPGELATRIRDEAREAVVQLQNPAVALTFTLSIGAACRSPSSEDTLLDLVRSADEAMYEAKIRGRDQVVSRCRG